MNRLKFVPKAPIVDRERFIVDAATGKKVLHIGLGGYIDDPSVTGEYLSGELGTKLHGRLARSAADLTGLDVNPMTVEAFSRVVRNSKYHLGDITDPSMLKDFQGGFDLVIFSDVIEHLDSYRVALSNVRNLLAPRGRVLLSTANAFCLDTMLKMIVRYESVHPEHTAYFSYSTLRRLFSMNRLIPTDFFYCFVRPSKFDGVTHRLSYLAQRAGISLFPQFSPGIILLAESEKE